MIDGVLDFLVMILVLGIVTSSSLGMTLPLVEESKQMVYEEIYDKTAEKVEGEQANEYNGDGCMSYDEVILTVMSQSYFMPKPRLIDICGQVLSMKANQPDEIDPTETPSYDVDDAIEFAPNSADVGILTRNLIDSWYQKSELKASGIGIDEVRFSIEFDLGNTEQKSDDMYALFVLYQAAGESEPSLHKCLENGQIS